MEDRTLFIEAHPFIVLEVEEYHIAGKIERSLLDVHMMGRSIRKEAKRQDLLEKVLDQFQERFYDEIHEAE